MGEPKELSTDDFIRFLNATRPNSECPGCGKSPSRWTICSSAWKGNPADPDGTKSYMEPMFHRFRTTREDGVPYGMTTYGMYCVHCGHFEQIISNVIERWLQTEAGNGDA